MQLTDEQREDFIRLVAEGMNRQTAAEELAEHYQDPSITATKIKFLCRKDGDFNRRYEEALIEGRGTKTERLERCAEEMAMNGHWGALKFLLTAYSENFAWARSSKVEVGGTVEIHAVAAILSRYLPPDEYDALMQSVEQKMLEEGPQALPPAVEAA